MWFAGGTVRQLICIALLCVVAVVRGQQPPSPTDTPMEYEDQNQIDYKALTLHTVAGNAHDEQGVAVPTVRLGLFTESDHKLVASTEGAADGTFKFANVAPGLYRLVAKYDGFCPANVPIRVIRGGSPNRGVDLHMKPRGLDSCSYGTIGAKDSLNGQRQ